MPARLAATGVGKGMELIRPLVYVPEELLVEYAQEQEFPTIPCGCPTCGTGAQKRQWVKRLVERLEDEIPGLKKSILTSMKNVAAEQLLLNEGGLRIPFLARWPGRIEPGRVSDLRFAQTDVLPTLTELVGARTPEDVDGISILPELLGAEAVGREQSTHPFLYWEFGSQVAVRAGDWKAIRPGKDKAWALYDLARDPSERADQAAAHPEPVAPGR